MNTHSDDISTMYIPGIDCKSNQDKARWVNDINVMHVINFSIQELQENPEIIPSIQP